MTEFDEFAVEVGRTLHEAQRKSGVTVDTLVKRTRLSRAGIYKIFAGRPPTLRSLFLISKAMNCQPGICIVGVCTDPD